MQTCRDEILAAWLPLAARNPDGTVSVQQAVDPLMDQGARYAASTIRTHVASRMCADAPDHHARVYHDLERVAHGQYRLRRDEVRCHG